MVLYKVLLFDVKLVIILIQKKNKGKYISSRFKWQGIHPIFRSQSGFSCFLRFSFQAGQSPFKSIRTWKVGKVELHFKLMLTDALSEFSSEPGHGAIWMSNVSSSFPRFISLRTGWKRYPVADCGIGFCRQAEAEARRPRTADAKPAAGNNDIADSPWKPVCRPAQNRRYFYEFLAIFLSIQKMFLPLHPILAVKVIKTVEIDEVKGTW